MKRRGRASEGDSGIHPSEEVVRLPVAADDLSGQLEAMPAPARRVRMQPSPAVDLHEEEAAEPTAADLGMPWEDEDTGRHETPVGWLGLIGLVLIGLGAWALTSLRKGEASVGQRAERIEETWNREQESLADAEELLARVERSARVYLAARDVAEKAKFVRHRDRVVPLMESYYTRHDYQPSELVSIEAFRPFAIGTRPFILINVRLKGGELRPLSMEQTAGGELEFDWESEVAYQPISIEDFVEQKPEEAVDLRVYARLDNYYGFEFDRKRIEPKDDDPTGRAREVADPEASDPAGGDPDDDKSKRRDPEGEDAKRIYRALLLTERDSEQFLFGYVERGTEDDDELVRLLTPNRRVSKPVMLRVRFLPGTRARRSVLVEKLISTRWIYGEDPRGTGTGDGD